MTSSFLMPMEVCQESRAKYDGWYLDLPSSGGASFHYTDGGRSKSQRPRQRNDCAVRATAIAFEIPYDEAYRALALFGRPCGRGVDTERSIAALKFLGDEYDKRIVKHRFPAIKDRQRMNVGCFSLFYSQGRFIMNEARHLSASIDGVIHDEDVSVAHLDRCVYQAYEIVNA